MLIKHKLLWNWLDIIIIVKCVDKKVQICYHLLIGLCPKTVNYGGIIMEALEKVFEIIDQILNIIKEAFAQLFPKDDAEAAE